MDLKCCCWHVLPCGYLTFPIYGNTYAKVRTTDIDNIVLYAKIWFHGRKTFFKVHMGCSALLHSAHFPPGALSLYELKEGRVHALLRLACSCHRKISVSLYCIELKQNSLKTKEMFKFIGSLQSRRFFDRNSEVHWSRQPSWKAKEKTKGGGAGKGGKGGGAWRREEVGVRVTIWHPSTSSFKSVLDSLQLFGSINVQDGGITLFPHRAAKCACFAGWFIA